MSTFDGDVVVAFASLMEKAKKIAERRSMLQAQEATISKQLEDVKASLIKEYGEDYMAQFNEAVVRIQEWDKANAQS